MPARIVAFSGNTHRPSRTRTLVEAVAAELSRQRPIDLKVYDLVDAGTGIAVASRSALPLPAARIVEAIETADALIVGSPVYKGSYAGLFKHLIDFVSPEALIGKPVVLTATGGGPRHALVVEHSLRPLFGFFSAQTAPTAVYAGDTEISEGRVADPIVRERVAQAAAELARLLDVAQGAARSTAASAPLATAAAR
ncbi:FMN reductase [Methylobacterium sp. DM1]|uniref:NADH-dependent FMN reductase SfnF n=1 Tax=Methylorubrum aminovorans TaxID=269069 RepID=A0ABQ4UGW4_9HYPH|nr:FMN reductase [Methylorubrum aminovorans]AWI90101.1 FMN reductase [Methylobacterium sp. DM1]GJE66565.1 NADH-dependent FMN reductase SfnF [Methylorubrum aminovorans]GMA74075.1 FMN reductase [Methylorubrum aminovorans]